MGTGRRLKGAGLSWCMRDKEASGEEIHHRQIDLVRRPLLLTLRSEEKSSLFYCRTEQLHMKLRIIVRILLDEVGEDLNGFSLLQRISTRR